MVIHLPNINYILFEFDAKNQLIKEKILKYRGKIIDVLYKSVVLYHTFLIYILYVKYRGRNHGFVYGRKSYINKYSYTTLVTANK